MTIRGIRWLQNLCRGGLVLAIAMTPALFLVESPGITRWIHAATGKNNYASHNMALVIPRLRCPVCRHVFVGRGEYREIFTPTCRNCGRRAGDTS